MRIERRVLFLHSGNTGRARATTQVDAKPFESHLCGNGVNFYAAVTQILRVAGYTQPFGYALGKEPISDSLHNSAHQEASGPPVVTHCAQTPFLQTHDGTKMAEETANKRRKRPGWLRVRR